MLQNCWFLNDIPDGIGEIPTLELIELKGDYNTSLKESVKSIQEEQQSYGNDAFEGQIVQNCDHYSISPHQKQQIISLNKSVTLLRDFLEDFPEKADNILERRICDLANEVENIMEYFMWRTTRYGSINWIAKVKFKFELNKVAREIDTIAGEVLDKIKHVSLGDDDSASSSAAASASSRILPSHKKETMVGFDDHLLAIKELLCGDSSKLQVIPIVGMGGIGKTTLATYAYLDPLITEYFQIRVWVTVSQDYSPQKVLSDILTSMKELHTERSGQSDEEKVHKSLKGSRYLIVLDDMWSTHAWDDIKMIFPDDNNGSRIMLTTRVSSVAAYADSSSSHLYEMQLMDEHQSWNLLRQKVFKQEYCPLELESIGMMIARSCGGLPLAIVMIGGLLSTVSKTRSSWEDIAENVNSAIATKDGQIEKILSLSYTHLPHHLRPCFLYMGAFPEDYEIRVSKLVNLWIAEGFIRSSVYRSSEEGAEEYLEDLVKRSLVMVSNRKSNGKIKSCRLHDIIRELCVGKAQQEKFLVHVMDTYVSKKGIKNQRRVCITQSDLNCLANIYGSTTRTLLCFSQTTSSLHYLENFKLLRVLDVVYAYGFREVVWVPAQVFELFHLRYLGFGCPIEIPAGISNLQNLQTLIIHPMKHQTSSVKLPLEIWRMSQLRHLICFNFGELPNSEEPAISALENLQTLSSVTNFVCTEGILKLIPNVKKLGIFYSEERDMYECVFKNYLLENLVHLEQLEKLKITVNPYRSFWWEKFKPSFPRTLKRLSLSGWGFRWEDITRVVGSLPYLEVLKLRYASWEGGQWETNEGEFPHLKYLLIEHTNLEHWITESSHFPSLKCLLLHHCQCLSEIPDGVGEIPTLELIEVKECDITLAESAKSLQEEQKCYGNDAFEVRCVDCQVYF